jgi:hypothetical protein
MRSPSWSSYALATALALLSPRAYAETAPDGAAKALGQLEANDGAKRVASEALARARAALQRAERMRAAGDEPHARLNDAVAAAFVDAAVALVAARTAQDASTDVQTKLLAAKARLERERALAEEAMMRKGQLEAQLEQTMQAKSPPPATKAEAAPKAPPAKPQAPKAPGNGNGSAK